MSLITSLHPPAKQTFLPCPSRDLFLDGNELQCEGVTELIKLCVDQSETEAYQREEEAKRKAEEEALQAENGTIYPLSDR